jgi:hypothetical protein
LLTRGIRLNEAELRRVVAFAGMYADRTSSLRWLGSVSELRKGLKTIYACEICEFGFADEETAELCEILCYSKGTCKVQEKAIHKPKVKIFA